MIGSPLASGTETAPINATATLSPAYDPLHPRRRRRPPPSNVVPPGYCLNLQSVPVAPQPVTTKSNTMPPKITPLAVGSGSMQYYWICLRRPANPFAPPQADISLSTYNPMVVVDAMRFPYTEGGCAPPPTLRALCLLMPRRSSRASGASRSGAVTPFVYPATPRPPRLRSTPLTATASRWPPLSTSSDCWTIRAGTRSPRPCTTRWAPSTIRSEPWDYFPFNDRDFTSVAELMLVPGCPPGLFTKQFVELAPMPPSTTAVASPPTSFPVPSLMPPNPSAVHRSRLHRRANVAQCRGRIPAAATAPCPAAHVPVPRG